VNEIGNALLLDSSSMVSRSGRTCRLYGGRAYLRLFFAYNGGVWNLPDSPLCDYTISCKGCGENIPAPIETMPDTWIVADCPLCGVKRRYMPTMVGRVALEERDESET
jgi:hypothetical protein